MISLYPEEWLVGEGTRLTRIDRILCNAAIFPDTVAHHGVLITQERTAVAVVEEIATVIGGLERQSQIYKVRNEMEYRGCGFLLVLGKDSPRRRKAITVVQVQGAADKRAIRCQDAPMDGRGRLPADVRPNVHVAIAQRRQHGEDEETEKGNPGHDDVAW